MGIPCISQVYYPFTRALATRSFLRLTNGVRLDSGQACAILIHERLLSWKLRECLRANQQSTKMRAIVVQMELAWTFTTSLLRYCVDILLGGEDD